MVGIKGETYGAKSLGNLGATETIDLTNGPVQYGTLDQNCTITLPALPAADDSWKITLIITQNGTGGFFPSFTAGGSIVWDNGATPTLATTNSAPTQTNVYEFTATAAGIYARQLDPNVTLNPISIVGAGTAYTLTNATAQVDMGTTDPVLIIDKAGTYRVTGKVKLNYAGATFAAVRIVSLKLRRLNNTASDLTDGSAAISTDVVTTLTQVMGTVEWSADFYASGNTDDQITIFAHVDTVPTAGTLTITEASVKASRVA